MGTTQLIKRTGAVGSLVPGLVRLAATQVCVVMTSVLATTAQKTTWFLQLVDAVGSVAHHQAAAIPRAASCPVATTRSHVGQTQFLQFLHGTASGSFALRLAATQVCAAMTYVLVTTAQEIGFQKCCIDISISVAYHQDAETGSAASLHLARRW